MSERAEPRWTREDDGRAQGTPMCARPKPVSGWSPGIPGLVRPHAYLICEECLWSLSLLEYEQGGNRMRWWRHAQPPVIIG